MDDQKGDQPDQKGDQYEEETEQHDHKGVQHDEETEQHDQQDYQHYAFMQWTIENFSCWKYEIHGEKISQNAPAMFDDDEEEYDSSEDDDHDWVCEKPIEKNQPEKCDEKMENSEDDECSSDEDDEDDTDEEDLSDIEYDRNIICIDLYPKGFSGEDEYMAVQVLDVDIGTEFELCFFDSSETLLSKVRKKPDPNEENYKFYCLAAVQTNLKFEDVVSRIVRDPNHVDALIIRYTRKSPVSRSYHLRSKVNLCENLVKIQLENISDSPLTNERAASFFQQLEGKSRTSSFHATSLRSTTQGVEYTFELKPTKRYSNLVRCYVYILDSDNSPIGFKEHEHLVSETTSWIFSDTLPGVQKGTLLVRVKTVSSKPFHCIFSSYSVNHEASEVVLQKPSIEAMSVLSDDLQCLYQERGFADFELRCGEATFPVHRCVLSARSPVFKAILLLGETSMDVSEDLDVPTLGRFLTFLYTGTCDGDLPWESALKLYSAADKYQVASLKTMGASALKSQLCVANVCEVLSLAEKHADEGLRFAAVDVLLLNYEEVLKSQEWGEFMQRDPALLCRTLTELGKRGVVGRV